MNRLQFFQTVKLARATVCVTQDGDKGFKLTASVSHGEDEKVEIGLLYKDEPRYFRGLSSVGDILRENDVLKFDVVLSKDEVMKATRGPRTAKTATKTPAKTANTAKS